METIKFSILIPCYNYAHFLDDCLTSVMDQTVGDWEAIVVDDASTQGDPEAVVSTFQDPRIRFVRHEQNRGAGATFNTAFKHSENPYVFLLSADDRLTPHFLEKIRDVLVSDPAVDVVTVDFQLFGNATGTWNYGVFDAEAMTRVQWIPGPASVMKRRVWEQAGGHYEGPELKDGNLDWDFWLSAMREQLTVVHIPELLYLYRVHGSSITSKRAAQDDRIHDFLYRRHQELFDRYGTGNAFRALGYMNSAVAAWKKDEHLRALQLARDAWKLAPNPESGFQVLSHIRKEFTDTHPDLYSLRQEWEQRLAASPDSGTTHTKENVFLYKDLARLCVALEEWQAAEHYLLHAIAFMKNTVQAAGCCNLLGLVYMKKKDPDLAMQALALTLCYDPENRGVFLHQSHLFFAMGQWMNALLTCLKGLTRLPGDRPLLMALGKIASALEANRQYPIPRADQWARPTMDGLAGEKSFLYASALGQKIYWMSRARDLYDKYGDTQGGFLTLQHTIESVSPKRILEIGCGNGRNFPLYASMNIDTVVGQDISIAALELAEKRGYPFVTLTEKPVPQLDYPVNHFDLVVSNRVLQHVPPGEVEGIVEAICRMGRNIYINEITPAEAGNDRSSFYMFLHDYRALFEKFNYRIVREMNDENQFRFLLSHKYLI